MIGKKRLAEAVTRAVSGRNRLATGLTALCLTGFILLAGAGLAEAAKGFRSQLAGSEILTRLAGSLPGEGVRGVEPGRAASFLHYLNALAPAVLNLEIQPDEQLAGFDVLYDAAREWGITLKNFSFDEVGQRMNVFCAAEDIGSSRHFYDAIKASGKFSDVNFVNENISANFTINYRI